MLIGICLISLSSSTVKPHEGALNYDVPPTYDVNFDLDPLVRWRSLAQLYKPSIQAFVKHIESSISIPWAVQKALEYYATYIYKYTEYVDEMKGIAEGAEVPFSYVFLANFAYEMSVACSGIVIRTQDGGIMHGRNLDFPYFNYLSKLSAKVRIFKGGKWVATFDQLIGYVFVLTGQRVGSFAVNVDTRMEPQELPQVFYNVFVNQIIPSCGLVREVLVSGS